MTNPAHAADEHPDERAELHDLVSSLTGPMGAMLNAVTSGAVQVLETLLDRREQVGYQRGLLEAEHRVARQVGLPTSDGGVPGVLIRCTHCDGEGLLFRPDRAPAGPPEAFGNARTSLIPRIDSIDQTAIIPRAGDVVSSGFDFNETVMTREQLEELHRRHEDLRD